MFGPNLAIDLLVMRPTRSQILSQNGGMVHKYWRCHNKKHLLRPTAMKELYLESTIFGLKHKSADGQVKIHAYCVMDNHSHQQLSYKGKSTYFSNFMRVAHSVFGRKFNDINECSGKVANERPHTPLIKPSEEQYMRVHFYIEANPVRAGICKLSLLKFNRFSSYRFYAHGIKDKFSAELEIPKWYLALGKTDAKRQEIYRRLFKKYLEIERIRPGNYKGRFIGDATWKEEKQIELKRKIKEAKERKETGSPPSE